MEQFREPSSSTCGKYCFDLSLLPSKKYSEKLPGDTSFIDFGAKLRPCWLK